MYVSRSGNSGPLEKFWDAVDIIRNEANTMEYHANSMDRVGNTKLEGEFRNLANNLFNAAVLIEQAILDRYGKKE